MQLTSLHIKNFRCFSSYTVTLEKALIIIEGPNGSGKTSLLEALHYVCYGRSFRTRLLADLIADKESSFFIRINSSELSATGLSAVALGEEDLVKPGQGSATLVELGGSATKRLLKINNQAVSSYKELIDSYRVISVTEDDVMMIKGAPELRRLFIDQALSLHNPEYSKELRSYRHVLAQRNAMLARGIATSLEVWTEKLRDITVSIQAQRQELLARLEKEANALLSQFTDEESTLNLRLKPCSYHDREYSGLVADELRMRRTLFGAHLDDIVIEFRQSSSRTHASRGQQKLIVLMLKAAHLRLLAKPVILLIDDFLTDFDGRRVTQILKMITSLSYQVILTTPLAEYLIREHLSTYDYQVVKLASLSLKDNNN